MGRHLGRGRFLSATGQLVLGLGALILMLAFLGHAPALVLLGLVVVLLPIASVVLAGSDLGGIQVVGTVEVPQLTVGATTPMTLEFVTSRSRLPSFLASVQAPHIAAEPGWVKGTATGIELVVVGISGTSHGFLQHALVQLEHIGPWGLSASRARAVMELAPWPIVPSTRLVPAPALPGLPVPEGEESSTGRSATSGSDPRGMRTFRSGDEPRSVNWRATARVGSLTVREWDPPRQVPGVLIVPVLPDLVTSIRPPGTPAAGEAVLGALGSLGLAAAAEDRSLSLLFHGTTVSADGHSLSADGPQRLTALRPETFLAALAGVRSGPVPSLSAIAAEAAHTATPGSTVLIGIDLGSVQWAAADLLTAQTLVDAAGCRLEVVIEGPPWGWTSQVRDAFVALAERCPVTPVESLIHLDTAA